MLCCGVTCGESKGGIVLRTASTAVMTNDITEETRDYFEESTSILLMTISRDTMMEQK